MASTGKLSENPLLERAHACSLYLDDGQKQVQYTSYLSSGLLAGERCLYFADSSKNEEIIASMNESGFDVGPFMENGAFQILRTAETYLAEGRFDEQRMVEFWQEIIKKARTDGFKGLRVAAEMTWACSGVVDARLLEAYEIHLNELSQNSDVSFLCMYKEDSFLDEVLQLMVYSHPLVLSEESNLLRNPAYLKPEDLAAATPRIHLQALLSTLSAFNRLAVTNERLKSILTKQRRLQYELRKLSQEKHQAEVTAAEERQYKLIAEAIPQIVWMGSTDTGIEFVNPYWCSYTGLSQAQSLGSGWAAALHPDQRETILSDWTRNLQSSQTIETEVQLRAIDGTYRWHLCRAVPIPDKTGAVSRWLGACVDIDRQKILSAELAKARDKALNSARLKSRFLANMSHEIRTPMNAVMGMCDILLRTPLNNTQHQYASNIKDGARALLAVINDILDFSKIEAGRLELQDEQFKLSDVIENVADLLSISARAKGLSLSTYIAPDIPDTLSGDSLRLRQILINLISNAIRFSSKGEIVVNAAVESRAEDTATVRISVKDDGVGISLEQQSALFRPFVQANTSIAKTFGGTGLGLSICKGLVDLMNGQIGFESQPEKGSTFWFSLPFKNCSHNGPTQETVKKETFGPSIHVLIVSLNAQEPKIWGKYLSTAGLNVELCTSAQECLKLLDEQEHQFSIALIDEALDGYSITERDSLLRKLADSGSKLILVAPADSPCEILKSARVEFQTQIAKPVRLRALLESVATAISNTTDTTVNESAPDTATPITSGTGQTVLIVEDNTINQQVARIFVSDMGLNYDVVSNGKEAVAACLKRPYDLILMDCEMPVMNGIDATKAIRENETKTKGHTPIVAMTGHAMEEDKALCLEVGMDAYLAKPLDPDDLRKIVDKLLPK